MDSVPETSRAKNPGPSFPGAMDLGEAGMVVSSGLLPGLGGVKNSTILPTFEEQYVSHEKEAQETKSVTRSPVTLGREK